MNDFDVKWKRRREYDRVTDDEFLLNETSDMPASKVCTLENEDEQQIVGQKREKDDKYHRLDKKRKQIGRRNQFQ